MNEVERQARLEEQSTVFEMIWAEIAAQAVYIQKLGGAQHIQLTVDAIHRFQLQHELLTPEYAAKMEKLLDWALNTQELMDDTTVRERTLKLVEYEEQLKKIDGMTELMHNIGDSKDLIILSHEIDLLDGECLLGQFMQKVLHALEYRVELRSTTVTPLVRNLIFGLRTDMASA